MINNQIYLDNTLAREVIKPKGMCDTAKCLDLITGGADPNCEKYIDFLHFTPLTMAASKGHTNVVRALIEHNASIDHPANEHGTPLMYAAREGHEDVVRLLIDSGAGLNRTDMYGSTAIEWAATTGQAATVKTLLDVYKSQKDSLTSHYHHKALMAAIDKNHTECAKILIDGLDESGFSYYAQSASVQAIKHQNLEILTALLDKGIAGKNLLEVAVRHGAEKVTDLLLKRGMNPNVIIDNANTTVLMEAAYQGSAALVQVLLRHGADSTLKDDDGETASDIAAKELKTAKKSFKPELKKVRDMLIIATFQTAATKGTLKTRRILRPIKQKGPTV